MTFKRQLTLLLSAVFLTTSALAIPYSQIQKHQSDVVLPATDFSSEALVTQETAVAIVRTLADLQQDGDADANPHVLDLMSFLLSADGNHRCCYLVSSVRGAAITRGQLAQLLYNLDHQLDNGNLTQNDLLRLLKNVSGTVSVAASFNDFSDIPYSHPFGRAIYHTIANGYLTGKTDGTFGVDDSLTAGEFTAIMNRYLDRTRLDFPDISQLFKNLVNDNRSALTKVIATNVFKTAANAIADKNFDPLLKTAIADIIDGIRQNAWYQGERKTIAGSPENYDTWVFRQGKGPLIREIHIDSLKPASDPVDIVVINDTHLNLVNERDEAEQNPAIMSTKQNRLWLRDGGSVPATRNIMVFAQYADLTIANGDILDYLSWGCRQLAVENVFRPDVSIIATLGGHETTRVMQGKVGDPSPSQSRRDWLQEFWPNDINYTSRVIKDKVLVVALDNGNGPYTQQQYALLQADLRRARENNFVVLIFQHEPISTRNPDYREAKPVLLGDPDQEYNFCDKYPGNAKDARNSPLYEVITSNADIIRGIIAGHAHTDFFVEIKGTCRNADGQIIEKFIPQYVLTCSIYSDGHLGHIIVK